MLSWCLAILPNHSNPESNCGFFKWTTDYEAELAAKRKRDEM